MQLDSGNEQFNRLTLVDLTQAHTIQLLGTAECCAKPVWF